ncbi:PfkB domain-containing protein [Catenovulum agarivorans DS-2]|uniref:PfkB domain-containing protein n=1 Tax=Catenovulum agarivorans DS-2 TaxID=1328313 RepID=W7QCM7_9ALTE|nr:sugar kinase [Catenovulum agarivorans]EWH09656.1 PfkB domain-containing protein [Catenovulum agarivorans DS-2]
MSIVFFGEIMQRLTPALPQQKLVVAKNLAVDFAGAEANVASSLARLGHQSYFATRLPDNPIGDHCIATLKQYGINTDYCVRGGNRIGSYFIELGASIRPSRVVYDRADSAFACLQSEQFDWENILAGKDWLFLGGITPALSTNCASEIVKAARIAQNMGVKVAFDINYRRSLWSAEQQQNGVAELIFSQILHYCDLAFANAGAVADVFGKTFDEGDAIEQAKLVATYLTNAFTVDAAVTARLHNSASSNQLAAIYRTQGNNYQSNWLDVEILDRLGTGDAFAAGLFNGLLKGQPPQQCIDFANAAFALAHTCYGDQHWSDEDEINAVVQGFTSGHVIR